MDADLCITLVDTKTGKTVACQKTGCSITYEMINDLKGTTVFGLDAFSELTAILAGEIVVMSQLGRLTPLMARLLDEADRVSRE